jgi:hypothetical protein
LEANSSCSKATTDTDTNSSNASSAITASGVYRSNRRYFLDQGRHAQQEVLSGLAGHFKLTKEGSGNETGSQIEIWSVESTSQSAQEFWEIAFSEGKVASIITNSLRPLQGEALTLAQRLFAELYPRGDVDNSKVGKFLGTRDLNVQVRMFQMTSDKGNEETMRFQFENGTSFEIKINVPVKGSPAVSISTFQTQ